MPPSDSFADLKARLAERDPAAPAEIVRRYTEQLVRRVAPRMVRSLAQKVDPEDFVQSALKSFFRADRAGAFSLDSWDSLWAVLATLTLRKQRAASRRFLTLGRNLNQELAAEDTESRTRWEAVARDPSPEEEVIVNELVERLLADAEDEKAREVIKLTLSGHTRAEVGKAVGLTERSVYRKLELIRQRLLRLDPDVAGAN